MVKVASLYDVDQRNDMQGLATDLTYEYPKKDAQKAFHWYKRAADREGFMSDVMACYIVGNTFTSGSPQAGVEKNDRLALRYYERCMLLTGPQIDLDMNVVDGVIPESQLRSRSPRSGNEHYFCSAAFQSGLILFSGSKNGKEQPSSGSDSLVEVDLVRAMRYWKQASMLGHAQASYNIGIMYAKGIGVEQDSFEAGKWFARALHLDDTRKLVVPAHIKLRNWNASKEELGDSLPVQQEQQQPSKPSSSPFSSSGSSSKPMSNAATTSTAKSTRRRERKKPIDYPDMDDSRGKIVALSSAAAVAGTIVWWYMKAHK
ncbi:uncharacterized protein BYT42DRAFT_235476 [Radiomyces spectabilis]|uniref:uncharacterized protein n=1 Tax=Radiomyces spectabilis TaxID=64574 RepID=UPI00221FE8AF|nr:uncharacterized protein BYT42DRAFT_235476 [Radiomyces spectabilis]KAI8388462.1 hypothetical protein BYT42DRAFT_235476 [Radiomyces spectabilis]